MLDLNRPCCGAFYCRSRWCATRLAPYIITLILFGTQGRIEPSYDLASDEIDIDAIPKTPGTVASIAAPKGRTQIVPVGVMVGIASSVIGITPHETECFGTHPDSGVAVLYG